MTLNLTVTGLGFAMYRSAPLLLGAMTLGFDSYVIAGILPAIGRDFDSSAAAVGQTVTMFTVAYALLSPICTTFLAGLSTRTVLIAALCVFNIGNLLSAVAPTLSVLLVSRGLVGVGAGVYAPMSIAAASALAPPERRARALALIPASMCAGTIVGVPAGLELAHQWGWRASLYLALGAGIVTTVALVRCLPPMRPTRPPPLVRRFSLLADRRILSILLVTMISSCASLGMYTYIGSFLHGSLGISDLRGYLWIWGAGGLLGSFGVGRVLDMLGNARLVMSINLCLLSASLMILPLAGRSAWAIGVVLFIWGAMGWSRVVPQQHRLLLLRPHDKPLALSLNSSMLYLGSSAGAGVGGVLLASGVAVTTLPIVFGALAAATMILHVGLSRTPAGRITTVRESRDELNAA